MPKWIHSSEEENQNIWDRNYDQIKHIHINALSTDYFAQHYLLTSVHTTKYSRPTLVMNGVMKTKNTSYKRRRPRSITHDWQTKKEILNQNFQRVSKLDYITITTSTFKKIMLQNDLQHGVIKRVLNTIFLFPILFIQKKLSPLVSF